MLFYLLSRGIDTETARALLIRAFLADALAPLRSPSLRRQLERRVTRALPRSQQLGDLP
jgi:Fe-S cluster assembly scaffold protein SufB